MCEIYIDQLTLAHPQLGTLQATQAYALTGNWTGNLSVHRLALSPLNHTSQGWFLLVGNNILELGCSLPQIVIISAFLKWGLSSYFNMKVYKPSHLSLIIKLADIFSYRQNMCTGSCGSVDLVLVCELKGCRLSPQLGACEKQWICAPPTFSVFLLPFPFL